MLIGQMISIFVVFAGLTATYFPLRKKINVEKYLKIISLVLAGVFFFRYMLGDDLIRETQQLQSTIIPSGAITFFSLVCVWSLYSLIFLVVLFPFFCDNFECWIFVLHNKSNLWKWSLSALFNSCTFDGI